MEKETVSNYPRHVALASWLVLAAWLMLPKTTESKFDVEAWKQPVVLTSTKALSLTDN